MEPSPTNTVGGSTEEGRGEAPSTADGELDDSTSTTVYVNNLNESVKTSTLRTTLHNLFSLYGSVLGITAHRSVRMRGQAFVAFAAKEDAIRAIDEVKGFPLYGKPMQCSIAKSRSDATVLAQADKEGLKAFQRQRLEQKVRQRREWRKRVMALRVGENEAAQPDINAMGASATTVSGRPHRQDVQMPDEYLPPNKILFLHNVPSAVARDGLDSLFRDSHPHGLIEVRLVPGRGVAFVEYADHVQSSIARDRLNGYTFAGTSEKLRITFAK